MGGWTPLGYDVVDRKLVVNEAEADLVRRIFVRFLEIGSVTLLVRELQQTGARTKQGKPFHKGTVYKLLNNRAYIGEAVHKGAAYRGEHDALIEPALFKHVQAILASNGRQRAASTRRDTPALLKGLIFTESGRAMTPTHTRKGSRLYRYYVSSDAIRGREQAASAGGPVRMPADLVETATVREMLRLIRSPQVVAETIRLVRSEAPDAAEAEIVAALDQFWHLWASLIPAEQSRVTRLLVDRVVVRADEIAITLRAAGLAQLAREMLVHEPERRAA